MTWDKKQILRDRLRDTCSVLPAVLKAYASYCLHASIIIILDSSRAEEDVQERGTGSST